MIWLELTGESTQSSIKQADRYDFVDLRAIMSEC
jgi:hypothetical protein